MGQADVGVEIVGRPANNAFVHTIGSHPKWCVGD